MHKLREYQETAADFLYENNSAMVLAWVGAGKTACALTAMRDMIHDGHTKRWLVLAPKRVAKEVWPGEAKKWAPGLSISVAVGTKRQRDKAFAELSQVVVANYDTIQTMTEAQIADFSGIVFDELTRLKNPRGKRFKALEKKISGVGIRWGLTGSFTSNGLEDVFGQCKAINPAILGRAKTAFMQQYFICTNRDYGLWTPAPGALEQVMEKIKPFTFVLENKDYKDTLPPLHTIKVSIPFPDREPYDTMKREFVVDLGDSQICALTAAAVTTKCRQMSSGFVYDTALVPGATKMVSVKTPIWFSKHKFDRLDEILDENQHSPTMVYYTFTEELAELRRRHPHVQTLDDTDAVNRFNKGSIELLAAHPKSASHGLNLQGAAHHIAFLSVPWSLDEYEQSIGRLHRSGQKHAVWVYVLMTANTIDQRVFAALHNKQGVSEIAMEELLG